MFSIILLCLAVFGFCLVWGLQDSRMECQLVAGLAVAIWAVALAVSFDFSYWPLAVRQL